MPFLLRWLRRFASVAPALLLAPTWLGGQPAPAPLPAPTAASSAAVASAKPAYDRAGDIMADLGRGRARNVLVVAHRADWREHPENSLAAVRSAVAMGVDIVEVDVRRTKDGQFVVIHDFTLDRTTQAKGKVADYTLAELRALRLIDANGAVTGEVIPTLAEVLAATAGRAVINLDKSFDHLDEIFAEVERLGAADHALFSVNQPVELYEMRYPGLLARMKFMLVVSANLPTYDALIGGFLEKHPPLVLQITFADEKSPILRWIAPAQKAGVRIWMNALWPQQNGGHHDDRGLTDPDGSWGWLVQQGATVIQTDRPRRLMDYLQQQGLRR